MIRIRRMYAGAVLLAGSLVASAAMAQGASPEPARVLILGTYHFDNPGLDVVKSDVADVLSPEKQREIAAVVEAIASFRPTKIAVEHPPSWAGRLDTAYTAYRAGVRELGRNETEQLGFRLAAMLGHERVHPIDHRGEFPFQAVMAYAQQHDPGFVALVGQEIQRLTTESNRVQREHTIGEILRMSNDPSRIREGHGMYMRFGAVGAGDSYVGAELLSKWYDRNIRIFANIQALTEPGDRILVLIGSGHAAILRELTMSDPRMDLVEANDYLPPPRG